MAVVYLNFSIITSYKLILIQKQESTGVIEQIVRPKAKSGGGGNPEDAHQKGHPFQAVGVL